MWIKFFIKKSLLPYLFILLVISSNLLANSDLLLLKPLKEYRGMEVIKNDVIENSEYNLPLSNLKRLGRGWQPTKSILLQGNRTTSLYKLGRSVELNNVYKHYRQELATNSAILYECSGRDCGNSNVWANNFFNDYRLYGADDNQFLLVTQNQTDSLYQVLYINRRGAGDVMVYLDRILVNNPNTLSKNKTIAFQTEVTNITKIRSYIESQQKNEKLVALVSSSKTLGVGQAVTTADQHIKNMKNDLGTRLSSNIVFVNIASFGREEFGEDLITLLSNE